MTMAYIRFAVLAPIILICSSCASLAGDSLGAFDWMIGDWVSDDGAISEHWHVASEQTFEGKGITRLENTISTESLRLLFMEDEVFYLAKVAHNEVPVAFRLTAESTSGHSIFVNPDHDFPKQIIYHRDGSDDMIVTVSDGGSKGFELRFARQ